MGMLNPVSSAITLIFCLVYIIRGRNEVNARETSEHPVDDKPKECPTPLLPILCSFFSK